MIMMLFSDAIIDFHLFYDGSVDIQIWALLTRSQCKVSDTQVTVKACGPLVFILSNKYVFQHMSKMIFIFLFDMFKIYHYRKCPDPAADADEEAKKLKHAYFVRVF